MATTKKAQENQAASTFIDSAWDTWSNTFNLFYSSQKEADQFVLKALEQQQESWEHFNNHLDTINDEHKKLRNEVRKTLLDNVEKTAGTETKKTVDQWNDRFEEVISRFQQLSVTPYREGYNLLHRSQEQFQDTMKKALDQQQKSREELTPLVDSFTKQVKESQNGFLEVAEKNRQTALKFFNQ
ncbi:hypothetical protein [Alkalicoccobacillus murimartini]|uniref:F0F1-type ATP synthase membrane subunit b/b n=1 Tax=Alkalicoccobacillus murimartini TaxID=171685 RepID=A0ABT9YDI0_9BACI|nr:hypothetical protein [Alkalicoccobacillus murimartini]MDQ0205779.1 F0F1-type ATP synthase membrane subunit b/b' [Alkalicoccobacillus murimartini]